MSRITKSIILFVSVAQLAFLSGCIRTDELEDDEWGFLQENYGAEMPRRYYVDLSAGTDYELYISVDGDGQLLEVRRRGNLWDDPGCELTASYGDWFSGPTNLYVDLTAKYGATNKHYSVWGTVISSHEGSLILTGTADEWPFCDDTIMLAKGTNEINYVGKLFIVWDR